MPGKGRGAGRPFLPGNPDGRAGRRPGSLNQTKRDARELAQRLLNDPAYQENLRERLTTGKLDAGLEKMLWQYAWGAPPDRPLSLLESMDEFSEL